MTHCLTLRVETSSVRPDWLTLRRLATERPPLIDGLKARTWRAGRRAIIGTYLFDGPSSLERFRGAMVDGDPALEKFLAQGPIAERVDDVPSSVIDRPAFILSAPRAGSTLLYDLLRQCKALWSIDDDMQHVIEGIPRLNLADRGYRSQTLDDTDAEPQTADTLRSCLLSEARSVSGTSLLRTTPDERPDRIRFLDKTPENALRVPFLLRVFPDARFIYLHRDLRQNVSSIVEAWKHGGFVSIPNLPGWSQGSWSFLLPERWREYDGMSPCHVAAFQWGAANHRILHGLDAIARAQWTTVSYDDLVAVPAAEVERLCRFLDIEPGALLTESLSWPLPLSPTTLTPPSPIKWKSNPDFDPAVVKPLQPLAGRMRSLRVHAAPPVSRSRHQIKTRFACFVDELEPREVASEAIVAPTLQAQLGHGLPLALVRHARLRERFLSDHPILWIQDLATNVWTPLWLRRRQAWLVSWLKPGSPPPASLTGSLRLKMAAAGVLTTEDALLERQARGERMVGDGRTMLERLRYCPLPKLIGPVLSGALSRYYNELIASGDWPLGDAQVAERHGWHNERVAQYLHHQLTDIASRVADRALKPTYSFASAYRGSAKLSAHMDREQCDYTLSLMIDEKRPGDSAPWPLWFQTPIGRKSVLLTVGDAVLFRGCELPHWREAASMEHEQINLLFHFVPAEWAGVMD